MQTRITKWLVAALVCAAVSAPLSGCTKVAVSQEPTDSRITGNQDSSTNKTNDDKQASSGKDGVSIIHDNPVYQTADAIGEESTLIVVAHYSESPEAGDQTVEYELTVDQVVSGDAGAKTLTFSQKGKPGNDKYERKLQKDTKYILFLAPSETEDDVYCALGAEQGIIEILNDDTVHPYSGTGITATYVGMRVQEVLSAIQAASN